MIMSLVFFVPCFAFGVTLFFGFEMVIIFGAAIVAEFLTFTASMIMVPAWDGSQTTNFTIG